MSEQHMIKEKEYIINNILAIVDIIITLIAFGLSFAIWVKQNFNKEYIILTLSIIPIWLILLKIVNLTKLHRIKSYSLIFFEYAIVFSFGLSFLFLEIFALNLETISRIVVFLFGGIGLILCFSSKILIYWQFKRIRSKGLNTSQIIIIADTQAENFINEILTNTYWGYKIKLVITTSKELRLKFSDIVFLDTDIKNVRQIIEKEAIDEVIYCKADTQLDEIKELIYSCEEIGVKFRMKSQFFNMIASRTHMEYFGDTAFLSFSNTPSAYFPLKIKRAFDVLFSGIAIILSSPIMLFISLLIKIDSKGPIIFRQERIGLRGRKFLVYKFRTMVQNADEMKDQLMDQNEQEGPVFKIKKDPRITKIGHFLRKTSLDEFPQFLNVLFGDMSVVGPRPPVQREVELYERWQLRRLSMKPGITCIWQVSGRNDISFEEWMRLDLQYIDTWSLKLDFVLILKTIRTVLRADGH